MARAVAEPGRSLTGHPGRVYLVGFMGAGKSTVGRSLAAALRVPFVDLDAALESMTGRTIRETFETRGEPYFREREAELLRGTADLPDAVVALGGGTFAFPANASFVKGHGVSVYLDAPFELIASRLGDKSADRPLFRSLGEARALWESRVPCYKMADWDVLVTAEDSVNAVVERVLDRLGRGRDGSGGGA